MCPTKMKPLAWTRRRFAMRREELLALALLLLLLLQCARCEPVCEIRQTPPRKNTPPLRFCSWYHASSCCLPAHDADMGNKFLALIEAGPTCEKYHNKAKLFLAMAFCYACDPNQPLTFSAPVNDDFFNVTLTAKICRSVTDRMAPRFFSDCGLLLPDDRETICSPNSAVVPELVWPDCSTGEYLCQDKQQNWYCNGDPCGPENTPKGFADAPCDEHSRTCDGALMFLNDNRAAKPPYFEDNVVEIIDEDRCLERHGDEARCRCMRPPLEVSRSSAVLTSRSITSFLAIVLWSMQ